MIKQGYNPDFWTQEYVEKLLNENFPAAKINDITAFTCMNFEDVQFSNGADTGNPDNILYFGFLNSYDNSAVDVNVLLLDGTTGVVTFACFPFSFPVLVFAVASKPASGVCFTGWKIVANSIVTIADDPIPIDYSLTDFTVGHFPHLTDSSLFYISGGMTENIQTLFANDDTPLLYFDGVSSGFSGYLGFGPGLTYNELEFYNHAVKQGSWKISDNTLFASTIYGVDNIASNIFSLLRAGSLSLSLGYVDMSGTYHNIGFCKTSLGVDINSLSVNAGALSFTLPSTTIVARLVLHVVIIDNAFVTLGTTVDAYHKLLSSWDAALTYTGWNLLTATGDSINEIETVQITGTPSSTVTVTVATYSNAQGATVLFDGSAVTVAGGTFTITLDSSGNSPVINSSIAGLHGVGHAYGVNVKYTITAVTAGTISPADSYTISKVFSGTE